jgi:hypothetical protein
MVRNRTADDGWADFPALSFSGATVLVQAPGFSRYRVAWRKGEKELTAELTKEAVIKGTIHDAAGKPLVSGHVNVRSKSEQISVTVRPDDKGQFHISELLLGHGNYMLAATTAARRSLRKLQSQRVT